MKLVIIESPYAGNVNLNLLYLRAALRDSLKRDEAPFASHALYTQPGVLDDTCPDERQLGISVGMLWAAKADLTAVYADLGVSVGMAHGIENAKKAGRPVEFRTLGTEWQRRKVTG